MLTTYDCTVRVYAPGSNVPIAGALVVAILDRVEVDGGYIVQQKIEATTDATGKATLALWPTVRGSGEARYVVYALTDGGAGLFEVALDMPARDCNLWDEAGPPLDEVDPTTALIERLQTIRDEIAQYSDGLQAAAPKVGGPWVVQDGQWVEATLTGGSGAGVSFSGLTSGIASPALSGTYTGEPDSITVEVNGGVHVATINGNGTWSLAAGTIPDLPNGSYNVLVTASITNQSSITDVGLLVVAVEQDVLPTVSFVGFTAYDATPALSGLMTGNIVSISVDIDGDTYTATKSNASTWSIAYGTIDALAAGTHTVTVTVTDDDGNTASDSGTLTVDLEEYPQVTMAPVATTQTSPALAGTVDEATTTVTARVAGVTYNCTNNGDGTWTLPAGTIANLAPGPYSVTVTATNSDGNTRTTTASLTIQDASTTPVVTINTVTSASPSPAFSGTINKAIAELLLEVGDGVYPATNNGDGSWSVSAGTVDALDPDTYTATITASMPDGGSASAQATVTIEGASGSDTPAKAVRFDGTGANFYTTGQDMPEIDSVDQRTLLFWVKAEAMANGNKYNQILGSTKPTYGAFSFSIAGDSVGYSPDRDLWLFNSRNASNSKAPGAEIGEYGGDNVWRLVAYVINQGTQTIYDCLEGASAVQRAQESVSGVLVAAGEWYIGAGNYDQSTDQVTGSLCHVALVDAVLTPAQITALGNGAAIDSITTPRNWWRLNGADDLGDYGSAGNALVATGTPTTNETGPANLVDDGAEPTSGGGGNPGGGNPGGGDGGDDEPVARTAFTPAQLGWKDTGGGAETVNVAYAIDGGDTLTLNNVPLGRSPLKNPDGTNHSHIAVVRYRDCVVLENCWLDNTQEYEGNLTIQVNGTTTFNGACSLWLWSRTVPQRAGLFQYTPSRSWDPSMLPNYNDPGAMGSWDFRLNSTDPDRVGINGYGFQTYDTMKGTGGRAEIGIIPSWDLPYAVRGEQWPACRKANDHSAVWPIHVFDPATGRPVDPTVHIDASLLEVYIGKTWGSHSNPITGETHCPWVPDTTHQTHFGIVPHLATGADYDLEEVHAWATYQVIQANPVYRGYERCMTFGQVRNIAWQMCAYIYAATLLPVGHPEKQTWQNVVQYNIEDVFQAEYAPGQPKNNLFGMHLYLEYPDASGRIRGLAPWQQHFLASVLHQGVRLGFANMTPWRNFIVQGAVDTMVQMCYQMGSFYKMFFRRDDVASNSKSAMPSELWSSWAEVREDTLRSAYDGAYADQVGTPCGELEIGGYGVGMMSGASGSPESFPANLQPALAAGVDAGLTGATQAWSLFQQWSGNIDYTGTSSAFNIWPEA